MKKRQRKSKDEKTPRKQQNGDDSGSHSPQHDSDMENGSPEKVLYLLNLSCFVDLVKSVGWIKANLWGLDD